MEGFKVSYFLPSLGIRDRVYRSIELCGRIGGECVVIRLAVVFHCD